LSTTQSRKAVKGSGRCYIYWAVFKTHASDGTIHRHGPRSSPCPGSDKQPGSLDTQQQVPGGANITVSVPDTNSTTVSTSLVSTPSQNDVLVHPAHRGQILKRIPKGARPAAANLLQKLINDVLQHSSSSPSSTSSWSRLLDFSTSCLVKPARGGKSRNLTTFIVKQLRQYELGTNDTEPSCRPPALCSKSPKTSDQIAATMASAKLEDGDVKGAVRLLCSDDSLAAPNDATFAELRLLHPAAPVDRRPAPSTVVPSLQVLPDAVKTAIMSFRMDQPRDQMV
jgi:hypothetical protein